MVEKNNKLGEVALQNQGKSLEVLERLVDVARPEAVFSKPVQVGDTQVITASEVHVGLGFGLGSGSGPKMVTNLPSSEGTNEEETGEGVGGGGGGGSSARPVAVITVRDGHVTVDPVLDATKIGLAFLTMLGSVFFMGAQMRKRK
jgi:uncharacterized spore protein YtfJ